MEKFKGKLLIILIIAFSFSQENHPHPPLELVTIPTAGTLPRGSFTFESLLAKDGGIIPRLAIGFTDNFTLGVSFGIQKFIGDEEFLVNRTKPEVQIKYRIFEETTDMPAIVYGIDTQGRGNYLETREVKSIITSYADENTENHDIGDLIEEELVSLIDVNRYEQKAWGMYLTLSKNYNLFGNLGFHIGANKNYWEISDGDKDVNFFIGLDKELNRSFSLLLEYDSALNDNDYEFEELSFGKGKGYLNGGVRWTIADNLLIELNLNNFNKNSEAEHINRQIKIIYSDSF